MTTAVKKVHPYYRYDKLYSYNAMIMMLCGGRGLGKTYGAKLKHLKKAVRSGGQEQFIYVRRRLEELKSAKQTFFVDIDHLFPGYDKRVEGVNGLMRKRLKRRKGESENAFNKRQKKEEWFIVCWFVALSVVQNIKSSSFKLSTAIIFDEFILEESTAGDYLPNEVEALMNFYNTVDRFQDKTILLMLSNSVSIMNPYFAYWDIEPDRLPEFSVHSEGDIVCHFPDAEDYQNSVYQTRFGKFIRRTMPEYADYAVGNKFRDANNSLLLDKPSTAKYKYTVEAREGSFSVWYDMPSGFFYVMTRKVGNERILTLVPESMAHGKIRVTLAEPVLKSLKAAFNRGKVVFDKPFTRNAFVKAFERK